MSIQILTPYETHKKHVIGDCKPNMFMVFQLGICVLYRGCLLLYPFNVSSYPNSHKYSINRNNIALNASQQYLGWSLMGIPYRGRGVYRPSGTPRKSTSGSKGLTLKLHVTFTIPFNMNKSTYMKVNFSTVKVL